MGPPSWRRHRSWLRIFTRNRVLSPRFQRLEYSLAPRLLEAEVLGGRAVQQILKAADQRPPIQKGTSLTGKPAPGVDPRGRLGNCASARNSDGTAGVSSTPNCGVYGLRGLAGPCYRFPGVP